jgi:hypothetical protein
MGAKPKHLVKGVTWPSQSLLINEQTPICNARLTIYIENFIYYLQ